MEVHGVQYGIQYGMEAQLHWDRGLVIDGLQRGSTGLDQGLVGVSGSILESGASAAASASMSGRHGWSTGAGWPSSTPIWLSAAPAAAICVRSSGVKIRGSLSLTHRRRCWDPRRAQRHAQCLAMTTFKVFPKSCRSRCIAKASWGGEGRG